MDKGCKMLGSKKKASAPDLRVNTYPDLMVIKNECGKDEKNKVKLLITRSHQMIHCL